MHTSRDKSSRQVTPADGWVLALVRDAVARARLSDGLRGRARLHVVATLTEAEAVLREARTIPIAVIMEATDSAGLSTAPLGRTLIARRPSVPVIGYCIPGQRQGREILDFARAGVHDLMFRGIDDGAHAIERLLVGASRLCAADEVAGQVEALLPARARTFVRFCLRHPEITTVAGAATALAVHRKTLFMQCASARLPPPGILLGWARLLLTAHLLATSHRTIETIANDLDFASVNAMRNMLKRYTGLRPSDVRNGGGVPMILPFFRDDLAARANPCPAPKGNVA